MVQAVSRQNRIRRHVLPWAAVTVGALVAIGATGCQSEPVAASHHLIGDLAIQDFGYIEARVGGNCVGKGDLPNVTTNAPVQVKDASGKIVGSGVVEQGKVISFTEFVETTSAAPTAQYSKATDHGSGAACRFRLDLGEVPETDIYSIEVAGKPLVTKKKGELAASNWKFEVVEGWTLFDGK